MPPTPHAAALPGRPPEGLAATPPIPRGAARSLALLWTARWPAAGLAMAAALLLAPSTWAVISSMPIDAARSAGTASKTAPSAVGPVGRPAPAVEGSTALEETVPETSVLDRAEKAVDEAFADLAATFELRIPSGGPASSGFWREAAGIREHFVIVEAVGRDGLPATWKVTDMDTHETRRVSRWAVRIPESEFARMASEKAIAGKISRTVAARKRPETYALSWDIETEGGSLLDWEGESR